MGEVMTDVGAGAGRRWLILAVGLLAMTAGCTYQYGLPYLPYSQ
jgi:1,4-dihydroxy-2-naphthoate octaprenyltransferase